MVSVSRRALGTVYFIMLMDVLNFGIVFPLVPLIAKDFGADAIMVGIMVMSYSLCQFLVTPLFGRISDKCGRRPVLLVAVLGNALASLGTGLATNFYLVLVARCVNGLSGGTMGVANAYIADVTTKDERSVYMSYMQAANAMGMVLGPAVGGALSRLGFKLACYVSAGLSGANFLFALAFLTESRWQQVREVSVPFAAAAVAAGDGASETPAGTGDADTTGVVQPVDDRGHPRIPRSAVLLNAAGFLLVLAFASYESIMSYYLMDTFFHGDAQKAGQFYGELFMVAGVVMFLVSALCYKPLLRCLGLRILVIVGTVIRTAGFVWQPLAKDAITFALGLIVIVLGSQLITPSVSSLLTSMVPETIYGRALSIQQASQVLARVIGPVLLGWIYDRWDKRFAFHLLTITTLLAGLLISMVPKRYFPNRPNSPDVDSRTSNTATSPAAAVTPSEGDQVAHGRLPASKDSTNAV